MKQLSILVPQGENNLSSIVGTYKIFCRANAHFLEKGKQEVFKVELIGTSENIEFHNGLFSVKPHRNIASVQKSDLIIIPSLNHNYNDSVAKNPAMIDWIARQYERGSEIASICTGAFLLATTGLLDGKSCSTHWSAADVFRQKFPKVNLQPDHLITDENGIATNGGAFSFLNLIVYLIEKYYDRETALYCAKVFQIDVGRENQSQFVIFSAQKKHGDALIASAQIEIENRSSEKISIGLLTKKFNIGRRTFDRRFIKATGNSPAEYWQRVKVESVKKALESGQKTVNEAMFDAGYSDEKAFRELFRRITGIAPLEYKKRYAFNGPLPLKKR